MKKKHIKIYITYILGFCVIYTVFLLIFFNNITNSNRIPLDTNIPNFRLNNQFEKSISFKDYKGKYLLVDFWFGGCKPCIEEMQYFPDLLEKYKSELTIISISIDKKEQTKQILEAKRKPWDFIIADNPNWLFTNDSMKDSSYVKTLGITKYPSYLLFNTNGDLIATPESGLAKVEYELGGFFERDLTLKAKRSYFFKCLKLFIPYSLVFLAVLMSINFIKKRRNIT